MGTQIKVYLSPSPRETFGVKDQRKGEIRLNCEGIYGNLGVPLILSVHMYPWPALYKLPCKLHSVSGRVLQAVSCTRDPTKGENRLKSSA